MRVIEWTPNVQTRSPEGLLTFKVEVLDERTIFGRVEYLITPVKGTGQRWVQQQGTSEATNGGGET